MKSSKVWKIREIVLAYKNTLEEKYSNIYCEGEISNLKKSSLGHWYFSLSDDEATINAALFRLPMAQRSLLEQLKDGAQVRVLGDLTVYAKRGQVQLVVQKIELLGAGDLQTQLSILRESLAKEGLFSLERKKKIPHFPQKIALITALNGAALQDFIKIFGQRSMMSELLIVPATVQGDNAVSSLLLALSKILKYHSQSPANSVDCVVLARGGGSFEDLFCFNHEALVRTLAEYPIPTMSAVGHEVDFTLCDEVCDLRAETPSSAAMKLTENMVELKKRLNFIQQFLQKSVLLKMSHYKMQLMKRSPEKYLQVLNQLLQQQKQKIKYSLQWLKSDKKMFLTENRQNLDECHFSLMNYWPVRSGQQQTYLNGLQRALQSLSPHAVLARGYTYLADSKRTVLSSVQNWDMLERGETISIYFKDGERQWEKN